MMKSDNGPHGVRERGLARLKEHDYHTIGRYWVTIDTHDRTCLLGDVRDGVMVLSSAGRVVERHLKRLPERAPVEVDTAMIMPNHVHLILTLLPKSSDPLEGKCSKSLAQVLQTFKTYTAAEINRLRGTPGQTVWQRNYFERVIRDEKEYRRFSSYALTNPARWMAKKENPSDKAGL